MYWSWLPSLPCSLGIFDIPCFVYCISKYKMLTQMIPERHTSLGSSPKNWNHVRISSFDTTVKGRVNKHSQWESIDILLEGVMEAVWGRGPAECWLELLWIYFLFQYSLSDTRHLTPLPLSISSIRLHFTLCSSLIFSFCLPDHNPSTHLPLCVCLCLCVSVCVWKKKKNRSPNWFHFSCLAT